MTAHSEILILRLLMPLVGAALYRWRGSAIWTPPRPIIQGLIALPFGFMVAGNAPDWLAFAVYCITTGALCLGHAKWQDMGRFAGTFLGDFAGMAFSGALVTLPAGVALLNPVLALSGAGKALAYALGWKIGKGTWLGECLTGFLFWGVIAI